jgi:putative endonuclease
MADPHEFGRLCEAMAAESLIAAGWRIVARNYRFGRREIDLIAYRRRVIAFVEVKGRRGGGFGHPLEAITRRKREEIRRVAEHWIARNGRPGLTYRFDAIGVTLAGEGGTCIEHVEDAWRL